MLIMEAIINPTRVIPSVDRDHRKYLIMDPPKEFMNWGITPFN